MTLKKPRKAKACAVLMLEEDDALDWLDAAGVDENRKWGDLHSIVMCRAPGNKPYAFLAVKIGNEMHAVYVPLSILNSVPQK